MKTEYKILKMMIENKQDFTIREIAKRIGADYRITYVAVQRLVQKNILIIKLVGRSSLCSLNERYYGAEVYQTEEERRTSLLKDKNINQLFKDVMAKVGTSFFICLLFGSCVKGKWKKGSDIDLIFVSNEVNFEKEIGNILSLLPLKIHVLVFTEREFKKMYDSKKLNVVREAMKGYVILHGIENLYYLKNA